MSPINHLLSDWILASTPYHGDVRDQASITIAAMIPDLDGFGITAELATRQRRMKLR